MDNTNNEQTPQNIPDPVSAKWDAKTYLGCFFLLIFFAIIFRACFCSGKSDKGVSDRATVVNSEWDSSVWQVEDYIKKRLTDPDSYESVNWSPVSDLGKNTTAPHRYIVRHMYRAKNSFGVKITENKLFYLDNSGYVVSNMDFGR